MTLALFSGLTFIIFIFLIVVGYVKKRNVFKRLSLVFLFVFFVLISWSCYQFLSKSYQNVKEVITPRTGDEIYDTLFDTRKSNCVQILQYQDQVIPKIDYAIWLHFRTCPSELKRILSKHRFSKEVVTSPSTSLSIPQYKNIKWFNPLSLGDTILIYEYVNERRSNIQTIFTTPQGNEVFVRDIFD